MLDRRSTKSKAFLLCRSSSTALPWQQRARGDTVAKQCPDAHLKYRKAARHERSNSVAFDEPRSSRGIIAGLWEADLTVIERHKRGGIFFEDFQIGSLIEHGLTRTVTQMDNMLFSNMTLNPQPLHIDAQFCATETQWGKPLMNSLFTLGLMIGISVNDTTAGTTIGNLGMMDVAFPAPLFEGDTVNCTTEIVAKRESRSRVDAGIVDFLHKAYKQDGTLVAQCRRQAFMRKRSAPAKLTG